MSSNASHSDDLPADCVSTRQMLLDLDLPARGRQILIGALHHANTCEQCRAAMNEFDELRSVLAMSPAAEETIAGDAYRLRIDSDTRPAVGSRSVRLFGAAAAITLVIGTTAFFAGRHVSGESGADQRMAGGASVTAAAQFRPGEAARQAAAFAHVSDAFDGRADWVAVSDRSSDVGLTDKPRVGTGVLLLRLAVTRRSSPSPAAIVSSADLAILPGSTADLVLPFPNNRELRYRIAVGAGDPTRVMLRADLAAAGRPGGESLAALATSLDLKPRQASSAGSFVTGSNEYELSVDFSRVALPARGLP